MHIKTLTALLGLLLGVVVGDSKYGTEIAISTLLLSLAQIAIFYFEVHRNKKNEIEKNARKFSPALFFGIFFFALAVGIIRVQFVEEKSIFTCETPCRFQGLVVSTPKAQDIYQTFSVRPETRDDVYDVQVKVPLYPRFQIGDQVMLSGKVIAPRVLMEHTGVKNFDYQTYLRVHSIGSEMLYPKIEYAESPLLVGMYQAFVISLAKYKEKYIDYVAHYVSEPNRSLATGMLFGNSSMSKELTQTFRTAGLSHIVVLSGFNIALVISFVLIVLFMVPLVLRICIAAALVVVFVLAVGGEASVIRATLMSFVALLALLVGRAYVARQALLISLFVIIFYAPEHLISDVSLHLSFLATAGIIYLSDSIKQMLVRIPSITYQEIITTTVAAYLATLPYVMYTFGTISLYSLLANVLVLPLVPLIMCCTFLIIILAPLSHLIGMMLGYIDSILVSSVIFVARTVEKLPFSSIQISYSFTAMCLSYLVLIGAFMALHARARSASTKNETIETKDGEIISGILSY